MTLRRDSRGTLRDYRREYSLYGASTDAKKDRASRNKVRRAALRAGRVHKGDGTALDHINSNPRDSRASNIRVISRSANAGRREDSRLKGSKRSARRKTRG